MKVEEALDGKRERRVLVGMAVDAVVLGRVSSKWGRDGLFASKVGNLFGGWCVDYYKKHAKPPGRHVVQLFEGWQAENPDRRPEAEMLERLLASLDDEYDAEDRNSELTLDLAGEHFRDVQMQRHINQLQGLLDMGKGRKAQHLAAKFTPLEMGVGAEVDLVNDREEVTSMFTETINEKLIDVPGPLGRFFGHHLARDCFVAVVGPEKSGKSFWLQWLAWQAMLQRRRVAYFEAGDLSKRQVELRFMVLAAQHPYRSSHPKGHWPCEILWPTSLEVDEQEGKKPDVRVQRDEVLTYDAPLDEARAWAACERIMQQELRSRRSHFKLFSYPNDTLTVATIKSDLESCEQRNDGWSPDVVVIDYSDILARPPGAADERDGTNTTWKQLRALSSERHCLVLTASQTDADSYERWLITRKNFSGDKRKHAHVTGEFAINQTAEEKRAGTARLNWIELRDGEFHEGKCVYVAPCLALGQPAVLSAYPRRNRRGK